MAAAHCDYQEFPGAIGGQRKCPRDLQSDANAPIPVISGVTRAQGTAAAGHWLLVRGSADEEPVVAKAAAAVAFERGVKTVNWWGEAGIPPNVSVGVGACS